MDSNKNMQVLSESHNLVLSTYKITKHYPKTEEFALTSQMRRSAISVPSNITEGKARNSQKEYIHFLYIARGSLEELKYQYLLSRDLGYISKQQYDTIIKQAQQVGRLLNGLIQRKKQNVK